jgi:peptidoglycan/LPS O-acetylase OafA/YrhL
VPSGHSPQSPAVPARVRSTNLDCLRAIAVLLVLFQHQSYLWPWTHRIGWAGVDLFFVLSGFLVTGLLIEERASRGQVDIGRFLVRRAFKIYPLFWLMIATTLVVRPLLGTPIDKRAVLAELVFLQNYGPGLWVQTWSLAVEEHFYLAIAGLFAWANRRAQPFKLSEVVRGALLLLLAVLIARILIQLSVPDRYKLTYWGTHARLDALLFGALLAFLHHAEGARLATWVRAQRPTIALASAALLLPVFALGEHALVRSFGFTLVYVAFGGILLLAIHAREGRSTLAQALAHVGRYSYGIYLWHLPIQELAIRPVAAAGLVPPDFVDNWSTYFTASILGGIAVSRMVEMPLLALRDRLFPPRSSLPAFAAPPSDVQVSNVQGVLLDELAAGFDQVAHQRRE